MAIVGEVRDRQTNRHTDAGDIVICPMLSYSNGTDKNACVCMWLIVMICYIAALFVGSCRGS